MSRQLGPLFALAALVLACQPARQAPSAAPPPATAAPAAAPAATNTAPPSAATPASRGRAAPSATARGGAAAQQDRQSGPLAPVVLEVGPRQQVDPFRQQRTLQLPAGWRARLFAAGLTRPRLMAFDANGVLHVSQVSAGSVVALPDRDGDGLVDEVVTVHEGLTLPHGLVFRDGWLYVAETGRVVRLAGDGGLARPRREVVVDSLSPRGGHFTRTLAIDPEGALYVSVGSTCNVCEEEDPRRAAIVRYQPDGSGERIYARGLRNAVGLAWRPGTGELWATNNGRDWLGDDEPPETINLVRDGADYGWPRCLNGKRPDPDFGRPDACTGVTPPRAELQAHAAPLGLTFWPDANHVLVALHGSWNRTVPAAPRLVQVALLPDGTARVEDFATGWQTARGEDSRWGRPVDVIAGPDGALYASDDHAGAIYRLSPPR